MADNAPIERRDATWNPIECLEYKLDVNLLTEITSNGVTRFLQWHPGFDNEIGVNCVMLVFGVSRSHITITWKIFTEWWPRGDIRAATTHRVADGLGVITSHAPRPAFVDQVPVPHDCPYVSTTCYSDENALAAERLFNKSVEDPAEIWPELERWLVEHETRRDAP